MNAGSQTIVGQVVDIAGRKIAAAEVSVVDGRIAAITPTTKPAATFLLPGFVDAHVHVESSMLVPSEFARAAVVHGTVATVSDPHEIGNVLGVAGVHYMLENASHVPFKFYFGAPSCVPATTFETAGATISVAEVEQLLDDPRIVYLSEMMNFPGILFGDPDCLAKVRAAHARNKPVDGHAPGLRGADAAKYIAAGITTDHECFTKEEALDKIAAGCKISIREGSAARNFDALHTLIGEHPAMAMLCSDDKHPDELLVSHINALVRRAVERVIDVFDALQAACVNPVEHYKLNVGQLRVGDPADFIEVDSLTAFNVKRTWIDGKLVAENGKTLIPRVEPKVVNHFTATHVQPEQFAVKAHAGTKLQVIEALDGQLITNRLEFEPLAVEGVVVSDPTRDLLKLVVVNRYTKAAPAIAFIKNFGLQSGAMASSVAHDSHNVIAVGVSDDDIAAAVNAVMDAGGGLAAVNHVQGDHWVLPLPVAGLMATGTCAEVGHAYQELDAAVKRWGSTLRAPYMTLSFMALLVIPALKLSDKGLFDGGKFEFTPLLA
ncbi:adenine deaminase [Lacipirellula parvula]|uniref:Adenine deaminase n=1 Tax=Lacipirellula parvula TaxID=2650471 RepID=A0A5K7XES6_9BACT|nr:adenine deaminase [Lacipirellula parvula]BBO32733.1 adenine deaminase [Lacipirellula parvula]